MVVTVNARITDDTRVALLFGPADYFRAVS
jgi:hypothetical protein